ncbi:MAG TPA: hypothetical protein DEV81_20210 [Cyanobacteria bacterium UBA11049]|nr:hypothetical protein [Cyanobacteria bacterium UBA11049]
MKQAERLESLKAGVIAAVSLWVAFIFTTVVNSLFLAQYFVALSSLRVDSVTWQWLVRGAIAIVCGLLFGVTYRYAIRSDDNFQLKSGTVLAFGLVRGLTQLDIGLNTPDSVLPFVVMAGESIFWFALAAVILNWAMQRGWVKTFN